jgi:DNA modification methylase
VPNDDRADWGAAWALIPSDVLYLFRAGLHAGVAADAIVAAGFDVRAQLVWAKPAPVLSRGAYHWQHEGAYYAVRRGAPAHWIGDRRQTTLWQVPPVSAGHASAADALTGHAAQKPVALFAKALANHTGDVLDPFAGTGTTLIAAEQLGRRASVLEIDPAYAQVALERWEVFTGTRAERG